MNLDTSNWKPFILNKLYIIYMGNGFDKNKMIMDNPTINFVSRVSYNNGVDCKVEKVEYVEPYKAGLLTVALGGSYLGSCFIQEEPFYTAQNVAILEPRKNRMTHYVNLFISCLIRNESKIKYYAFGRELNSHINTDFNIKLPIKYNDDGTPFIDDTNEYSEKGFVPDWKFMEDYIKSLNNKPITTRNNATQNNLDINNWKEFSFGELISDIYKANAINKDDILPADSKDNSIRYITRTGDDNGCELLADKTSFDNSIIEKGNAISIGDTTATCFYQEEKFIAGDHMVVVRADSWMNPYTALFVLSILNKEQYRYSYGRAFLIDRIKATTIKLPVDEKGNPNWKFMEKYIKSLQYGDRLEG